MPIRKLPDVLLKVVEDLRSFYPDPKSDAGENFALVLNRKEGDDKPWNDLEILGIFLMGEINRQEQAQAQGPNRATRRSKK